MVVNPDKFHTICQMKSSQIGAKLALDPEEIHIILLAYVLCTYYVLAYAR